MPRKSDFGTTASKEAGSGASSSHAVAAAEVSREGNGVSIEDNTLPKSLVVRLVKGVLAQNTNIQKDAQLAITKGATVFINHLADEANQIALRNNRKTITPKDVLEAITQCELDEFRPRLEAELAKFETIQSEKRAAQKQNAKAKEAAAKEIVQTSEGDNNAESAETEEDSPPPAKKRKSVGLNVNGGTPAKKTLTGKRTAVIPVPEPLDDIDEDEPIDVVELDAETDDDGNDEEATNQEEQLDEDEVIEDIDDTELPEDEALDNGDDSD